ncbi:hypothetical protein KUL42_06430 [Alteromonas sp. KUL42]|nr:hypothetical protein KUL42_06430 [Alteromonas sp. KUL42]
MKINGLRWWVIALIALATIINYIDRQALSVLWPDIVEDLFPDESALERKQIYANISIVLFLPTLLGKLSSANFLTG